MLVFLISWLVVGIISLIGSWILELRGSDYDENYFDKEHIYVSFLLIVLGYLSPLIICMAITSEKKYFTKFVYKVANIGFRNKENKQV